MRHRLAYFISASLCLIATIGAEFLEPRRRSFAECGLCIVLLYPVWAKVGRTLSTRIKSLDFFSPLVAYPLAYIAWFVFGSIDFVTVPSSTNFGLFEPITANVFYIATAGLAGYLLGVMLFRSRAVPVRFEFPLTTVCGWDPERTRKAAVMVTSAMIFSFAYTTAFIGVPLLHLSSLADERIDFSKIPLFHLLGGPAVYGAYTILLFVCAWFWIERPNVRETNRTSIKAAYLFLGVALLILASQASRAAYIGPILTLLIGYHYARKRLSVRRVAVVVLAAFVFFSAFGYFRDLTSDQDPEENWLSAAGVPPAVQPLIYVGFYMRYSVATLRDVAQIIPSQIPFQHGAITTLPLQVLLPGHHGMSDMYFKNLLGNEFVGQGQPATVLGPFYADFGIPGVFFGMLAWGAVVARLYRWMLSERTAVSIIVFAWVMQLGLFGLMGGIFGYLEPSLCPLAWIALDRYLRPSLRRTDPSTLLRCPSL